MHWNSENSPIRPLSLRVFLYMTCHLDEYKEFLHHTGNVWIPEDRFDYAAVSKNFEIPGGWCLSVGHLLALSGVCITCMGCQGCPIRQLEGATSTWSDSFTSINNSVIAPSSMWWQVVSLCTSRWGRDWVFGSNSYTTVNLSAVSSLVPTYAWDCLEVKTLCFNSFHKKWKRQSGGGSAWL